MKKYLSYFFVLFAIQLFAQKINLNLGSAVQKNYFEEIDFEYLQEKIIIPVTIKGKTYRFILDTGAPNIISKELNEIIQAPFIDSIPVIDGYDKKEQVKVVRVDKIDLGKLTFKNSATLVYDFESTAFNDCFGIDGFIGSNMLRNSIVQIDLENQKVRITDNKKSLDLKRKYSSKIKLNKVQSLPFVEIRLKGTKTGKEKVLLDTGMQGLFDLSKRSYEIFSNYDILKTIGSSEGSAGFSLFGVPTMSKQYKLQLPKLYINGLTIENCITETGDHKASRIGSELLKYGLYTIDFQNKRFYFKPKKEVVKIEKATYGFSISLKNDKLIVGFVWDEALKKVLHYGDEITEVNGKHITLCDLILDKAKLEGELNLKIKPLKGKVFDIIVNEKVHL